MKLSVGGEWGPKAVPHNINIAQAVSFAYRLKAIHPLFAEISAVTRKGGSMEKMLKQPLVWDMTPEQWAQAIEENTHRYDGEKDENFGYRIKYWNRHRDNKALVTYQISCNAIVIGNGVGVDDLPPDLNKPEILDTIMAAIIDCFEVDFADIGRNVSTDKAPIGFSLVRILWKSWVRKGDNPWPGLPDWEKSICGEPTTSEPWHGGTLFTWPHHAPWLPLPPI